MKISVLGNGRWGAFIAWYLDKTGHCVCIRGRKESAGFQKLRQERKNERLSFSNQIEMTTDLGKAVQHGEVLVISISCQHLREFMAELSSYDLSQKAIVLCMKGLEEGTGLRLTQIVAEFADAPAAIWVGPGHVEDFAAGVPNCMVIDSQNAELKKELVHAFSSPLIRFYYGADLIGSEIGAASKNVIGIAAGMLDGLGLSSLKGALMSRGTIEIARLIGALGGKEQSAYGLCHLGDYEATVFSSHSHNRRFGEAYIKKESYPELAEGVSTTSALMLLGRQTQVELPICSAVDRILHHGEEPETVLSNLFLRSIKQEFE